MEFGELLKKSPVCSRPFACTNSVVSSIIIHPFIGLLLFIHKIFNASLNIDCTLFFSSLWTWYGIPIYLFQVHSNKFAFTSPFFSPFLALPPPGPPFFFYIKWNSNKTGGQICFQDKNYILFFSNTIVFKKEPVFSYLIHLVISVALLVQRLVHCEGT